MKEWALSLFLTAEPKTRDTPFTRRGGAEAVYRFSDPRLKENKIPLTRWGLDMKRIQRLRLSDRSEFLMPQVRTAA